MRALLLAAAGLDLQDVARALGSVGVDDAWVQTANLGDPPFDESSPDFVLAVLSPSLVTGESPTPVAGGGPPFSNLDVAIRAGRAAGQGYPVLLVVPPPLSRPT